MTTIVLRTSDQHLIVTNKVKIAKGDINSVKVEIHLDSAWDEFPHLIATFANDAVTDFPTFDMALGRGFVFEVAKCTIPAKALSKAGTLSISISGYSADGTQKKTSTIAKMKVFESLANAETTIEPEMDLYMQYLAALKEELNPTTTYLNRVIEEQTAAVEAMIEEQRTWMNGDVLWENPDPTAEMETLTINLDRTPYTRLHVLVKDSSSENKGCVVVHDNGRYRISIEASTVSRYMTVTDSTVAIDESSHSDGANIPYKIIGYKY